MTDLSELRTYRVIVEVMDISEDGSPDVISIPVDVLHTRGAPLESILDIARTVVLSENDPSIGQNYRGVIDSMTLPNVVGARIIQSWN